MRPAATVMTKIALAGIGLPVILVLLCYLSLSSGGADHNRAAVHLAFDGGDNRKCYAIHFFDKEESNARNKQRIVNNFGRYYLRKPLLSVILCVQRRTVKDGV